MVLTNPKYKLLHFLSTKLFYNKKKAQAFNWDRCCHSTLVLADSLPLFSFRTFILLFLIRGTLNRLLLEISKVGYSIKKIPHLNYKLLGRIFEIPHHYRKHLRTLFDLISFKVTLLNLIQLNQGGNF